MHDQHLIEISFSGFEENLKVKIARFGDWDVVEFGINTLRFFCLFFPLVQTWEGPWQPLCCMPFCCVPADPSLDACSS